MPVYTQVTYLPILLQVSRGAIAHLSTYLEQKSLLFKKVLVITGKTFSAKIATQVLEDPRLSPWKHITIESNSLVEVEQLRDLIYQNSIDLIIGIGGGKVIDVTKRLSLVQRVNCIVVPTTISNDGLISPISVLRTPQGITQSIAAQMPMGVVVDLNIVESAPKRYLQAAAGDVLSNLSATHDWVLAQEQRGEQINDIAYQMSIMSAYSSVNFYDVSLCVCDFLKQIVYAQFNSGIAMAVAGTSRPCSGSEHLISHAIDYLGLSDGTLHGLQVGSISLFSLYLQQKLCPQHVNYAFKLGIPLLFTDLSPDIANNLLHIFETARVMRPDRYTILDCLSDQELIARYRGFCTELQEMVRK